MLRKKAKCVVNAKQYQVQEEAMIRFIQERNNGIRTGMYEAYSAGQGDEMPLYEQDYVDDPTYDGDIEMDDNELDMDDSPSFDDIDATIDKEHQVNQAARLETPGASDAVEMGTLGESRTPPNLTLPQTNPSQPHPTHLNPSPPISTPPHQSPTISTPPHQSTPNPTQGAQIEFPEALDEVLMDMSDEESDIFVRQVRQAIDKKKGAPN